MYKDDSFYSTKFSTDRGYATSLDMNIYLWKEDIEDGESVMTAEYRPVEYGKDYDVVNNPDKFQLYIDGKEVVMQVNVGDKVIYSKYAGTDVELDKEEYIIVKQSDILAIVTE